MKTFRGREVSTAWPTDLMQIFALESSVAVFVSWGTPTCLPSGARRGQVF